MAAALRKAAGHLLHAIQRCLQRRQGTALGKAANVAGALALQGDRRFDHLSWTSQIAQAPAGHGPTLGEAIDHKQPISQIRSQRGQAVVGLAIGEQVLVDLIADHSHLGMAAQQGGNGFQLLALQHQSRWIGGCVEHQQATLGSDQGLESLKIKPEAIAGIASEQAHLGSCQARQLGVSEPVRRRQQHLITRVEQHLKEVVKRLLAAIGDQHLITANGHAIAAAEFLSNGLPQRWITCSWAVTGHALLEGLGRRLANKGRCIEVGFAGTEAADVLPLGLQLLSPGRNGKRQRWLQRSRTGRKLHGHGHTLVVPLGSSNSPVCLSTRACCARQHQGDGRTVLGFGQ